MKKIFEKRCCKKTRTKQRGGMLLEVLVSILLFALGIVALVGLQARSLETTGDVQYRAEAVHLARAYEAKMRAASFANINNGLFAAGGNEFQIFTDQVRGNNGFQGLPGATLVANNPQVVIVSGVAATPPLPAQSSRVQITIFWRAPGDVAPHSYTQDSVFWNF